MNTLNQYAKENQLNMDCTSEICEFVSNDKDLVSIPHYGKDKELIVTYFIIGNISTVKVSVGENTKEVSEITHDEAREFMDSLIWNMESIKEMF